MTLDELKAEAKKQGYSLVPRPTYIRLARCPVCHRFPIKYNSRATNNPKYVCDCGLDTGWQKTDKLARETWNKIAEG